nr:Uncharacterised protein [Klebsiella pneumoniae]
MKDSQKLKELDGALLEMLEIKARSIPRCRAMVRDLSVRLPKETRCFRRNWLSMNIC